MAAILSPEALTMTPSAATWEMTAFWAMPAMTHSKVAMARTTLSGGLDDDTLLGDAGDKSPSWR
ncbi:MAG TPA: hypothetical protein VGQ99_02845 [Tepidisphaeraceae bacterium]|nr:hypothetical protein [Tepidisphaeraceae bacterium]